MGSRRTARWVVRRIVAERQGGATYRRIADRLSDDGVPTPGRGRRWSTAAVYGIANNPSYGGWRRWRELHETLARGEHEPLVDEAAFTP